MADIITTEYDDDSGTDFIQCEYCDKSIRGDTQYRIHLTTNQHLKKKESMNLKDDMPVWENFLDYLDYLRLDEPIIGLSALEQLESQMLTNGKLRLRYKCRMCNLEADLPAMASHVVGRKHRQKFLELRRPDLVTWDKFAINQQGKVIRAKAEVVERQEGRGAPEDLPKINKRNGPRRGNAPPNPRFQNQRQNMGPHQGVMDPDHPRYEAMAVPPLDYPEDPRYPLSSDFRRGADYPEDFPSQRRYPEEEDRFRPSFPESDEYGRRYPRESLHEEPYRDDQRRQYPDEPPRQAFDKGDRYEPSYFEDDPQGRSQPEDVHQRPYVDDRHSGQRFSDRDPPRRTYEDSQAQSYQEKEPIRQHTDYNHGKRLYSDRDSFRQPSVSEDYGQVYPKDDGFDRRGQEDMEREHYSRPYSKDESLEWHQKVDTDRRFPGRDEGEHYAERGFDPHHSGQDYRSDRSHSGFDTERNRGDEARYGGEMIDPRMDREQAGTRGARLRASETSNFPQQHRGLMGTHEDSGPTRKRRSRFTDCTEAEKELLQKYQTAQVVSQKLVQNPPPKVQRRTESSHLREDYREDSGTQQDPGNVLDVLKGVQIESVQEANFLKNKLCSLLKEFQANKSGPRGASPMGSRDHERPRREVQDRPRSDDYSFQMREMVAAERDREIQQPPLSVDYDMRSREMPAADRGYDEMQKQPPYDDYSYRMREMPAGRGRDDIPERLPSDDYNYPRREIPDVGRGPGDFRQISPERFDRRSYERDQPWPRGETSRPAEMFENFPRDDFNRGEFRPSPQDDPRRFHEGSQRSHYGGSFEEDPRDFHPHRLRTSFDEERRNPPSNLDKIASTLLQLVAHK